jgi:soluble lytic murein transglycosylase
VARVMAFSVIYDWRLNGKAVPLTTRLSAIGQPYGLPNAMSVHKSVSCPVIVPVTPPATPPASPATARSASP